MIHIYTGDGKGKTTCAAGLAARATGSGIKTAIFSFMKKNGGNEEICLCDKIDFFAPEGEMGFVWEMDSEQKQNAAYACSELLEKAASLSDFYGMMVLDEVISACECGFCEWNALLSLLKKSTCELVLTGRNAPEFLVEVADYVTEMRCVKHPYMNGCKARRGIEY